VVDRAAFFENRRSVRSLQATVWGAQTVAGCSARKHSCNTSRYCRSTQQQAEAERRSADGHDRKSGGQARKMGRTGRFRATQRFSAQRALKVITIHHPRGIPPHLASNTATVMLAYSTGLGWLSRNTFQTLLCPASSLLQSVLRPHNHQLTCPALASASFGQVLV